MSSPGAFSSSLPAPIARNCTAATASPAPMRSGRYASGSERSDPPPVAPIDPINAAALTAASVIALSIALRPRIASNIQLPAKIPHHSTIKIARSMGEAWDSIDHAKRIGVPPRSAASRMRANRSGPSAVIMTASSSTVVNSMPLSTAPSSKPFTTPSASPPMRASTPTIADVLRTAIAAPTSAVPVTMSTALMGPKSCRTNTPPKTAPKSETTPAL